MAQTSVTKKEYVARILKAQQPAIEAMAQAMAEDPAAALMQSAAQALPQRVPSERREAVAKDIRADIKRYVDEVVPMVRRQAVQLAPLTIGALLEEKLTEDELKEVAGIVESAAYGKFQQLGGDMQRALLEKLLAQTRGSVEPKLKALEGSIAKRLGLSAAAKATAPQGRASAPDAKSGAK